MRERTAPLPYITGAGEDINWGNNGNWLCGDVWNISSMHPNSVIVKIENDIRTNTAH
ncbi:MAG: hypothetical protein HRT68_04215 [Flavobacteriaceae bacterium]|nr:hypothetical protein [Flavobacteriaceae bacterium]